MPDKILELEATMRDRVSDTLRGIKRSVDDLNKSTVNLGTQRKEMAALGQELVNLGRAGGGIQQTTKHLRDFHQQFREISDRFRETGKSVKEQLLPAFEGLGFGVTTVGGAFAALLATMRSVISESQNLQNFAKLSGFDTDSVRGMTAAAAAFGVSSDKMLSILRNVGKEMDKIAGTPGGGGSEMLNRMRHTRGLEDLTRDIQRIANDRNIPEAQRKVQGLTRILEELQKVSASPTGGAAHAANIAEQLGLDPSITLLINQQIDVLKLRLDLLRRMGEEVSPDKIAANAVANAKLAASIEGIKNAVTRTLITNVTDLTNELADYIDKNNETVSNNIVQAVKDLGKAAKDSLPDLRTIKEILDAIQQFNAASPGSAAQRGATWTREHGGQQVGDFLKSVPGNTPVLPGVNALRGVFGASPLAPTPPRATAPQMYSDYDLNQSAMFKRGSLGTGSITGGWRPSENVEDLRSNEAKVADEASRKETYDNTAAERDNTDQLRKLIEILSRGNSLTTMDLSGGGGAGGQGGGYGAGQGPMYRPGVGPGASARPGGVHNAPRGETVARPPVHPAAVPKHTPGAKETPLGPSTPAPVHTEPQPLPPPDLMPGLQDGGVINRPSTVVDNATGSAVAQVAENGPEFFVPPETIQRMPYQPHTPGGPSAPVRYNNPTSMGSGQRARNLFYASEDYVLNDGHNNVIAGFPNPILGQAAAMDLYMRNYTNQTVRAANETWSGHNRHSLPGWDNQDQVVTPEMLRDPDFAMRYFTAMQNAEDPHQPRLSPAGLREAWDIQNEGGYDNYYNTRKGLPGAQPSGPGPNTAQSPEALGWKKWPLAGDPGFTKQQQLNRPDYYGGQVTIEGQQGSFQFGTGGTYHGDKAGAGSSAPYGDFYVNVGSATGGVGRDGGRWAWPAYAGYSDNPTGNTVYDAKFGANRPGVEVHAAGGGAPVQKLASPSDVNRILTEGCFGLEHEQWEDFKAKLDAEIKANGPMYLHTRPGADPNTGNASFTHSKTLDTGFDKFPKASWNPRTDQAITGQNPGRQIVPSSLQSGLPRGGNIDLSQPGLTSIPGVGGMLGAGAPKTEPAPPAATGPAPAGPAPTPATGAGQQPKHIRLGHGTPAYKWAPGQGGQTNVPGGTLAGVPPALAQQLDFAKKGQDLLGVKSTLDYAEAVASGQQPFSLKGAATAAAPLLATLATGAVGKVLGVGSLGLNSVAKVLTGEFGHLAPEMGGTLALQQLQTAGLAAAGVPKSKSSEQGPLGQALAMVGGSGYQPPAAGGLQGNAGVVHKVEGTGTIHVNVTAPRGTNVNAESGGLFKKVNLNRGMSMEHADERGHVSE